MRKSRMAAIVSVLVLLIILWLNNRDEKSAVQLPSSSTASVTEPTSASSLDITALTQQQRVVSYLQQNKRLPSYYITKKQARQMGWDARDGNLCHALPGKAIGGDRFSNREGNLPEQNGRVWHEADINYRCGHRGAQRLLYSNDGLIYITRDHYKNVSKVE